jgi:hypothetical protein
VFISTSYTYMQMEPHYNVGNRNKIEFNNWRSENVNGFNSFNCMKTQWDVQLWNRDHHSVFSIWNILTFVQIKFLACIYSVACLPYLKLQCDIFQINIPHTTLQHYFYIRNVALYHVDTIHWNLQCLTLIGLQRAHDYVSCSIPIF